jgi:NTP pyrophosphatase (non-canonical NTP hydrolase)
MTFDEYQDAARATAIYPANHAITYPTLGLCGESGEVAEKVKKLIRDDCYDRDAIQKELGDVLWYLSNLASDLGLKLSDVARTNIAKLKDRKERGKLQGSGDTR